LTKLKIKKEKLIKIIIIKKKNKKEKNE